MNKQLVENANSWMNEDTESTTTVKFDSTEVNGTKLDEIDAQLVRAGLVGVPDFNALTYTIKTEHLDRFIEIMDRSPYKYTVIDGVEEEEAVVSDEEEVIEEEIFSMAENLLDGFTYEELLDTVNTNEPERDEDAIIKVFNELVQQNVELAKEKLEEKLEELVNQSSREDVDND